MVFISPSILSADYGNLESELKRLTAAGADMVHIDVMDGHFVPNITLGAPVVKCIRKATDLPFDVHLMIDDPFTYVPDFVKAGADRITFHVECGSDTEKTIDEILDAGVEAGLAVKPGTPIETVFPYLDKLSMVLVMTVEPGFGGQSFIPGALDKLSALAQEKRRRGLPFLLEVDGGVDEASGTAAACVNAGAEVLVAGSAVFRAADPAAAVAGLLRL